MVTDEKIAGLAAIIPCYNAGPRLLPVVRDTVGRVARLYVVDDGSTDHAPQDAAEAGAEVIRLDPNRGKGHALLAGIAVALQDPGTQTICLLDADGQHDPAEITGLHAALADQGADLLIGSREFRGDVPLRSRVGNLLTIQVTALILGRRLPDTQSGYRMLSRAFAEHVLREVPPGRYETEMIMIVRAVRDGYKVGHAPIKTIYEPENASSHFRKLRDSARIYGCLLKAVLRRSSRGS